MPRQQLRLALVASALAVTGVLSCVSPPLESPPITPSGQDIIRVPQNVRDKVDVLFMIDTSNSMDAMQKELQNRFGQFFTVFQTLASAGTFADLHIGVITSDYGAGATGAPGCQPSPGGDLGRLIPLGKAAAPGCMAPIGANYIQYDFDPKGTNNLPVGQNLAQTFTCMAAAGTTGCGFEHVLESTYAALKGNVQGNAGFLRPDALLTVVFVTNEDDCSAPPTSDLFDKNKVAQFGYLSSYRCTRFGMSCKGQLPPYGDSGGPLSSCVGIGESTGGKLYDLSRYIDMFTKPELQGGVKTNPLDVILVGITPPAEPVQILLSNPGTAGGAPYPPCGQLNEASNPPCVPVVQHSCQNTAQPVFFGDPAVRLNSVIRAAKQNKVSEICSGDYTAALQDLANLIVSTLGGGCIQSRLSDPTKPDCVVEDVTQNVDGTVTVSTIPQCVPGNEVPPCWKIEPKDVCKSTSPDGVGLTIVRSGMAPPNTDARVACATIP